MINVQLVDVSFTDYDVTQVQVVDHDLCDSHEDFFALHPPIVTCNYHALIKTCLENRHLQLTPNCDLNNTAAISFMKHELLLKERIESSSSGGSLCLGEALLPADQVDLDPGGGQHLAPSLALQATSPDHFDLEVASLITHAELDVAKDRRTQHLASYQLAGTEAFDELGELALA